VRAPERIAFDARYVNDRYHGIGRYAFRLLEALVAAAPARTFIVFRGREEDSRFDWGALSARPNVELWDGPWPLYWPQEQLQWPALLRRSRADLFYSPYFVAPLLVTDACPAIVTVHDLIFDRYPAYMPRRWARPYYRLLMALSVRRARRVVAVSRATAADLTHYYRTPPDKVAVVLEGVDPSFATAGEDQLAAIRQRYDLKRSFVLTVGARRPHKNQARLVRAFARIPNGGCDLVFAGPADDRFPDEARRAVEDTGLNGKVRFLDWVPESDLPGLYALADLVALPSLVEGFGLPALEAMACGTPVLAANASSLPEVVGGAGVLVDPYDEEAMAAALGELLADRALRHRLARAGLARAATFTWQQAARRTLEIFEDTRK
jgi:glycosyltransferase involved in cell wall biosynthesis